MSEVEELRYKLVLQDGKLRMFDEADSCETEYDTFAEADEDTHESMQRAAARRNALERYFMEHGMSP